jgi:hypothetical protein
MAILGIGLAAVAAWPVLAAIALLHSVNDDSGYFGFCETPDVLIYLTVESLRRSG